jgi:hypothetical protein
MSTSYELGSKNELENVVINGSNVNLVLSIFGWVHAHFSVNFESLSEF